MLKHLEKYLSGKQITIISEKNVAIEKKNILKKINLKFRYPKFSISRKIAFYIFSVIKCETFGVKRSIS